MMKTFVDKPHNKPEALISFKELANVNSAHMKYLELNESFLFKSITGVAAKDNDVIYPFHRAKFGKNFRSSRLCTYPNHHGKSSFSLRALTLKDHHTLSEIFPNQTIPFGLLTCTKHRKQLSDPTVPNSKETNLPEIHDECSSDSVYVPEQFETTPKSRQPLDDILSIIEQISMKFQISKPVRTLQPSTLHYIKHKVNGIQVESIKKFIEHVAPVQGDSLQKCCLQKKIMQVISNRNLYDAFNASNNNIEKCAILSLIPPS